MSVGFWQLILILLIIMLLFGSGKLPQVMKELGQGIRSLKKELNEDKSEEKDKSDDNKNGNS
jgi:sec-independent protein translocase protein TatA